MKQKLKRFMAGFMAMLTLVGTLFTNGTTAFAASPQANIAFWNASVKNSGEVSELKPGYNHGKILYSILDGNSAYCMNFGLRADGGQLMNSYDDASTSMSAQQRKLLSYCLYYGFNSTQKAAPSNSQCDEYIATQAMVWVIVADIFGTGSGDSAARKLCNTAPSPDSSYSYYERLRDNISIGATKEQDIALEEELLADEKERAEHVMLVDLARNDMGRISEIGTVKVDQFMNIQRYSHVMHIVSLVEGRKNGEYHPLDLVSSFLPAGTLSGAPKIRAMEIIDELETVRRGLYGGATGYLDFGGNMNFCITIRTMIKKDDKVYLQAGAGIVADSKPEMEYQECCNKVMALAKTLVKEEHL